MIDPKATLIAICIWFAMQMGTAMAQQDPMYSMYMWNMVAVHPAYAGSADVLNATAVSRMQWTGLAGAPLTHSLSLHAPVDRESLGAGLSVVNDRIGRTSTSSVFGDIAYRVKLTRRTRLAFGLKFGFNHAQISNSLVENTDPEDPLFAIDQSGKVLPNFGFGFYLWSQRGYFGASIPKLRRNPLLDFDTDLGNVGSMVEMPHLFVTAGYVFDLGQVKFKPAVLFRGAQGVPFNADLSANFLCFERFWIGGAYRTSGSVSGIMSLQLNDQFRAGYSYDMGISSLISRTFGSHEIMLSYDPVFNKKKMRSPRYF